jgi:hypothetical protein
MRFSHPVGYNKMPLLGRITMSQSVTLRFTPNKQDYARVLRLFFWQRTSTRISLVFLAVAFLLIFYVVASQGTPLTIFELIWLFLPPMFVIFVFFIQPSRMASQAILNEQLVTEATWEVSDRGVEISSRFGSTHMDWDSLNKLVTTKEYYLLLSKINKNAFRFLPHRAITSPQEQDVFLELVRKYLPIG